MTGIGILENDMLEDVLWLLCEDGWVDGHGSMRMCRTNRHHHASGWMTCYYILYSTAKTITNNQKETLLKWMKDTKYT